MLDKAKSFLDYWASQHTEAIVESDQLYQRAKEEVDNLRGMPEIVCLAGSSRFKEAFERESERLTLEGCIVLGKHVYKPGEQWNLTEKHRDMIHAVQFRKVDLCHRVHIVNVDGYVGEDTYNLVRYALKNVVPVTFYSPFVKTLTVDGETELTVRHFILAAQMRVELERG